MSVMEPSYRAPETHWERRAELERELPGARAEFERATTALNTAMVAVQQEWRAVKLAAERCAALEGPLTGRAPESCRDERLMVGRQRMHELIVRLGAVI